MKKQHLKSRHHVNPGDIFTLGSESVTILHAGKKRTIWYRQGEFYTSYHWGRKAKYILYFNALKKGAKIHRKDNA